jgi:lambda family phage portal protein
VETKPSWLDRAIMALAPKWGASRARARLLARHFEAASMGRRTSGWSRRNADANTAAAGAALANIRGQARDLVRNNAWARRGLARIETATVGWGIRPKAVGRNAELVTASWRAWAESTQCDAAGRLTFYGLQALIMRTVVESGEVLVRRRRRRPEDGLAVPLQFQILEPDHLDTSLDGIKSPSGGDIIQGVEFDAIGRRVAYWLFDQHPGGRTFTNPQARRVPASEILHVFRQERAGQVRGVSWFAPISVRLHDFDEFEDATLMKQKIAACMAAFVTDLDGSNSPLGGGGGGTSAEPQDAFEPGMILNLPPGKQVTVANPPASTDHAAFSATALRGVAAGLGVTYEDLTGDYSQVNYSSARMARIAFNSDVHHSRWNMLIPQFCAPAWAWMVEALALEGIETDAVAKWTPPPAQMLDPDKEGAAAMRAIRSGQLTLDEMVREQGYDPDEHWEEYAAGLKRLDDLGIILDSDPRKTTSGGQMQAASADAPAEVVDDPDISVVGDDGVERALRAHLEFVERELEHERIARAAEVSRHHAQLQLALAATAKEPAPESQPLDTSAAT